MPAVDKLLLEDALQDSPQTRSLLSVFEEDAGTLTDYTNQLLQAMQRVYGAQNEMCLATRQLSRQLLAYEEQNFALGKGDEEVISTLHYFSKVVDELNGLHTELAKQLADTMVLPVIQFREKDLTEVSTLKDLFGLASNEHDLSMAKYSRLPKKKENERVKAEVGKEVAAARRKQHLSSLQYYCALNALQYRKRMAMMEPLIGFARGQINFFKRGAEMFSKSMDGFLSSIADMVQRYCCPRPASSPSSAPDEGYAVAREPPVHTSFTLSTDLLLSEYLLRLWGVLEFGRGGVGVLQFKWYKTMRGGGRPGFKASPEHRRLCLHRGKYTKGKKECGILLHMENENVFLKLLHLRHLRGPSRSLLRPKATKGSEHEEWPWPCPVASSGKGTVTLSDAGKQFVKSLFTFSPCCLFGPWDC